jgi:hypothetical protein
MELHMLVVTQTSEIFSDLFRMVLTIQKNPKIFGLSFGPTTMHPLGFGDVAPLQPTPPQALPCPALPCPALLPFEVCHNFETPIACPQRPENYEFVHAHSVNLQSIF